MGRQYQQAAIARAYATAWQRAEPGKLTSILADLNTLLAGRDPEFRLSVSSRLRSYILYVAAERSDYRVKLKPGVEMYARIKHGDVKDFQRRQAL